MSEVKVKKIITKDFFDEKIKTVYKTRDKILFKLAWETGSRISELLSLHKQHINFKDNLITIPHLKRRVAGATRELNISENLKELIQSYTEKMTDKSPLFKIKRSQALHLFQRTFGKDATPRQFRHSFAIDCAKSQVNIEAIRRAMGHTRLDVTQVYLDYDTTTMKNELSKRKV